MGIEKVNDLFYSQAAWAMEIQELKKISDCQTKKGHVFLRKS